MTFYLFLFYFYSVKHKRRYFKENFFLIHSIQVSGVQNNIAPHGLSLYEKKKKKLLWKYLIFQKNKKS